MSEHQYYEFQAAEVRQRAVFEIRGGRSDGRSGRTAGEILARAEIIAAERKKRRLSGALVSATPWDGFAASGASLRWATSIPTDGVVVSDTRGGRCCRVHASEISSGNARGCVGGSGGWGKERGRSLVFRIRQSKETAKTNE